MKYTKNTMLNYLTLDFWTESNVNSLRIKYLKHNSKKTGNKIVYLMEREIRAQDNWALSFAFEQSKELNLPLLIVCRQDIFDFSLKNNFISRQIQLAQKNFEELNINFKLIKISYDKIATMLEELTPQILIIDFNPILERKCLKKLNCSIVEVDGHNIIPARYLSNKQEYNARTIRKKIYQNIYSFLTEFPNKNIFYNEAEEALLNFIETKLENYNQFKNDYLQNYTSQLSKYLNLGFISSQRVAIEILKRNVGKENQEAFLEELIVRKELADNFCLYAKNYKNFSSIPTWAKTTLQKHKTDTRPHIYTLNELEFAKTDNEKWNRLQKNLITTGIIQGYARMYWAKELLKWTISPQKALEILIYLNDKYALDAPSCNGYVGILWSIAGLHDRAFRENPIFGKIRKMNLH